jgi:hypothetical protein
MDEISSDGYRKCVRLNVVFCRIARAQHMSSRGRYGAILTGSTETTLGVPGGTCRCLDPTSTEYSGLSYGMASRFDPSMSSQPV